MKKLLVFGVIVLFLGLAIAPSINADVKHIITPAKSGNTLYVGGNGTGNYTKIQDAIDDASDGDTVYVYDDSSPYYENVVVEVSINLIGEDKNTTVIDANDNRRAININSTDWVNISGFSTRNGDAGIGLIRANHTTITGNIISDNWFGMSIYLSQSNIISNNSIISNDYGVSLNRANKNTIISNNITLNGGYGIELFCSYINTIIYNEICLNWNLGLSMFSTYKNTITRNNFLGNGEHNFFQSSWRDTWHWNHWDNWRDSRPYPIIGSLGPFGKILWLKFDWRPALKPYDIEV